MRHLPFGRTTLFLLALYLSFPRGQIVAKAGRSEPGDRGNSRQHGRSLAILIHSGVDDIDSIAKTEFISVCSRSFHIVDSGADFRLRFVPIRVAVEDTILNWSWGAITHGVTEVTYDVYLDLPNGMGQRVCGPLTVSRASTDRIAYAASVVVRTINRRFPPTGRVLSMDGPWASIDIGSEDGVRMRERFDVFDANRSVALAEVRQLHGREARVRRLRGRWPAAGATVRQLWPWRYGMELTYTHFTVNDQAGRDVLLRFVFSDRRVLPVALQFSTGYIDLIDEFGWHILNLDVVKSWEIVPERLSLDVTAGIGYSMVRLERNETYPGSGVREPALGVGNYNLYAGVATHVVRPVILTTGVGYLGYNRFPRPTSPAIQISARWMVW